MTGRPSSIIAPLASACTPSQQTQSSWRRTLGDSTKGRSYISCYVWYLCLIRTWEIQRKDEEPPGGCAGGGHVRYRKRKRNCMSASRTLVLVLLFVTPAFTLLVVHARLAYTVQPNRQRARTHSYTTPTQDVTTVTRRR
ncbi:hypothetical protein SCLCIDRAFT_1221309, partial [Scleroderma citrinum Foug A]